MHYRILFCFVGIVAASCSAIVFADKPDRPEEAASSAEAPFTWRRDAPYGELGFPGTSFGPHWEYLRLVTHHAVQEELDLSPEQIEQLQGVYKALMSVQRQWASGRENEDYLKAPYEQAREILTEEQSLRIEQIQLQRRGVQAFLHADIQETLGLAPKQIETIRAAWKEHVANAKAGWKGDEGRRSYHNVWKLALETLSESQRRTFYQMTGPVIAQR
jgi:hypothetical protein